MLLLRGGAGVMNNPPVITELQLVGEPTQASAEISYKVSDADKQIVRHYITIPGLYDEKEITKDVGYEKDVYTYKIEGLTKNTTYSVVITCSDGLAKANSEALQIKTKDSILYSFTINENDSNPRTRVGYGDEASGVTPATKTGLGGWANKWPFNKIRIVGLQDGKITKEIKKANKKQYVDGSSVPTDGSVDVMTEFPTIYWRKTAPNGNIKFEISDYPIVGGDCYAHKVGNVIRPTIYVGSYLGNFYMSTSGKFILVSTSGVAGSSSISLSEFREFARNRGTGYELLNFNILTMLQILFTLAYKNTNSQSALGMGYVGASSKTNTGGTDTKGWVYGSASQTEQMCFLGIEDLWGNLLQWVDGLYLDANYNIKVCTDNVHFNDTGSGTGWETVGTSAIQGRNGYMATVDLNTKSGFLPKTLSGSDSTYYTDHCAVVNNCVCYFGGYFNDRNSAGVFRYLINLNASNSNTNLGARLCYIGEVS